MSPQPTPPLAGVRVVDCSDMSPGPYATQLLADLGADVIVVERPEKLATLDDDLARLDSLRRGKRSIVLDLKAPGAVDVVKRLVATADVFVEGWRPGVADRLGLGAEALAEVKPDLVYCSVTGFGQQGPLRNLAGHDLNYLAIAGILGVVGHNEQGPVPPLNVLADYAGGGLPAAFAIVVALLAKQAGRSTGPLDVSMTDAVLSFMGPHLTRTTMTGDYPAPGEHVLAGSLPQYRSYRCSDGGWLSVAALEDRFFDALVIALDLPELVGAVSDASRRDEITRKLTAAFATAPRDVWFERLAPTTCVAPVLDLEELPTHPAVGGAGRLLEVTTGTATAFQPDGPPGFPHRLSGREPYGPLPAEDTDDLLAQAGFDADAVQALVDAGAVRRPHEVAAR